MVQANEIYRHFKGNLYRIVTMARHSETGEELVVYQALYGDYQVYARPLSMFMEKTDKDKYPDAVQEYRFELQKELIGSLEHQGNMEESQPKQPEKPAETECAEEELNIDPLVLEFLDAGSYE